MPALPSAAARDRPGVARAARRGRARGRKRARGAAGGSRGCAVARAAHRGAAHRRRAGAAVGLRPGLGRVRRGAEVPGRLRRRASCCACTGARATPTRSRWRPARSTGWRSAGCTTCVGGGFHRYSVDGVWLVPHFEKMLYDNALLASAYLEGHAVTGNPGYRRGRRGARSTSCCASCACPRAASPRRSMPTPTASRARLTCGRRPSSTRRSARRPARPRRPTTA